MSPAATDSVRASLTAALEQLQRQRDQLEQELAGIEESEAQLRSMLGTLADAPHSRTVKKDRTMQISEKRLARVRDYIVKHERARQPDIARALGENSGTVSVAMRLLARDGLVYKDGLERGATVWRLVSAD